MEKNQTGLIILIRDIFQNFKQEIQKRPISDSGILMGTAIIVGVGSGLGAVLFTYLIETVQKFTFEDLVKFLNFNQPIHLIIIPVIGALITGPIIYHFAQEAKGHGVPEVMLAIALRGGLIKARVGLVKTITSAICIGTGGSVGSEGPIAQIGASIGSKIGQILKLDEEKTKTLVACGAAGGIAAIFNAPITGAIFAMEILLNRINSVYFGAVVISSVIADSIAHFFMGDFRAFLIPQYFMKSPWELLLYSLLAILAAFASVLFSRSLYFLEDYFDGLNIPQWVKPSIGAVFLGILGIFTIKTMNGIPRIFGVGYDSMTSALFGEFTLTVALSLFFLKLLATLFTLGSGNSGGVFAPSLYLGSMLGASFGNWANSVFPNISAGVGAYALIGMASFFSGTMHAPMTAIMILFEMTGNYQLILPLMLASVISSIISGLLSKDSIYTLKLTRRGIHLNPVQDVDVMQGVTVGEVMSTDFLSIQNNQTIQDLAELLSKTHITGIPVLNDVDQMMGVVTMNDLESAKKGKLPESTPVSNISSLDDILVTYPDEPMWQAIYRMSSHNISMLPVVLKNNPQQLVGILYRRDVIKAYDRAIAKKANMQQQVETVKLGKIDETRFFQLNIPANSSVVGKRVSEIKLPGHCVIISLRRGRELKIVDGHTILKKGDFLTIFSEEACSEEIVKVMTGQSEFSIETANQNSYHEEILVMAGSKYKGVLIKELNLPKDILIVSIQRKNETIIPHGETEIQINDIIEVYGKNTDINFVKKLFEPD